MLNKWMALIFLLAMGCTHNDCKDSSQRRNYPEQWWQGVTDEEEKSWEVSPDSVQPPQVILSKRNNLGVLSNFAETPFELDGQTYASVEGFWQATKYPENQKDLRAQSVEWPYKRNEVAMLSAFKAKKAGDFGSQMMLKNGWDWVTYQGKKLIYRENKKGRFYDLILRAMTAKLQQNLKVQQVLCATGQLELLPDHKQGSNPPPAWKYYNVWEVLRSQHC